MLYSAISADIDILITGNKDFSAAEVEKPEILTSSQFNEKIPEHGNYGCIFCFASVQLIGLQKKSSCFVSKHEDFVGEPGGIRTHDLLIRSQTLYPAELRAHSYHLNAYRVSLTAQLV